MISVFPFKRCLASGESQGNSAFYMYQVQTFEREYLALLGAVCLANVKTKAILPHEQTFGHHLSSLHETLSKDLVQRNPIFLLTDDQEFTQKKQEILSCIECIEERQDSSGAVHRLFRSTSNCSSLNLSETLCVADGHHRINALMNYYEQKKHCLSSSMIMAAIFNEANIRNRNKGVILNTQKINGRILREDSELLKKFCCYFDINKTAVPQNPRSPLEFSMFDGFTWFQLTLKAIHYSEDKHKDLLAIEIFKEFILKKIFNIENYTQNPSVKVVFETCNITSIKNDIKDSGCLGFVLASDPTSKIIKAARQERILEPNSTYFEPKFLTGMINHPL